MNCEKCGVDAPLAHRDVDGFAYYLCADCVQRWDAARSAPPEPSGEGRSAAR